jgi:hypothetical protein
MPNAGTKLTPYRIKKPIAMNPSTFLFIVALTIPCHYLLAQDIVGDWQLIKQSSCLEEEANGQAETPDDLRKEMHGQSPVGQQVVSFKSNASGEESTRILNSGKTTNSKKFFYKFNGEMLLILDKKSQTISDSYMVDKFTTDSLIVSNASRPCETMIFLKINEQTPN